MQVVKIIEIGTDTYALAVKLDDGGVHETACTIRDSDVRGGKAIEVFNFESDDFQKRIMAGEIDVRAVMSAVQTFRGLS